MGKNLWKAKHTQWHLASWTFRSDALPRPSFYHKKCTWHFFRAWWDPWVFGREILREMWGEIAKKKCNEKATMSNRYSLDFRWKFSRMLQKTVEPEELDFNLESWQFATLKLLEVFQYFQHFLHVHTRRHFKFYYSQHEATKKRKFDFTKIWGCA